MPPSDDTGDLALMGRFQRGDLAAFDALVRRHLGFVVRHARRYVADESSAEDVAQDVFLRLYRARDTFRDGSNFLGWLATITTRVALNELRTRRRKHWVATSALPAAAVTHAWRAESCFAVDPAEQLLEVERIAAVRAAMRELPHRQRLALTLQRFEGWDLVSVGAALDLTVPAVKSLLFRARASLMTLLTKYIEDPLPLAERRSP